MNTPIAYDPISGTYEATVSYGNSVTSKTFTRRWYESRHRQHARAQRWYNQELARIITQNNEALSEWAFSHLDGTTARN